MTRSARQVAFGAMVALVGCSVYDASLLVGGTVGSAATGDTSTSGGVGGSHGGGTGGSSGTAPEGGTSGGSSGSGGTNGGSSAKGGSANGGTANGGGAGSGAKGGSANGGTTGGTDTSPGGMADEAGMSNGGDGTTGTGGSGAGTGGSGAGMGGSGGAGIGGSAGSGGTTGGAGSGGGGTGGSAGSTAGTGGAATAMGCAVLSASLASATDKTHYLITLGSADVDFTNAVISAHVYAKGTGGGIFVYVQEATYEFWSMPLQPFSGIDGWTTLSWDLGAEASTGTLDKTKVRRLGFEIIGTGSTSWTSPTVAYVDSITVTTPALSFPFDTTATVTTTGTSSHTGDTALWLNNSSSDTTAAGSTVAWAASCP